MIERSVSVSNLPHLTIAVQRVGLSMKSINKQGASMKSVVVMMLVAVALVGCGRTGAKGDPGQAIVGPQGNQGLPGQNGSDGSDGVDATPVTVVKLCPGVTTYPSTFVEVAFCIGGKLYGTYSANGGFSTELPPGAYNSNAIGSSCSFTVLPQCVIQN